MLQTSDTILITGAAGFIGSCMVRHLNMLGFTQLILVDDFSIISKEKNTAHLICKEKVERTKVDSFLQNNTSINLVIHLGARTDTTEMNEAIHEELNVKSSKVYWQYCTLQQIPLIYASSAATYGNGEYGYNDLHEIIPQLQPLNPYGVSKNEFDKWAITQLDTPPFWYGLKFFNVYGPNEYHKGRMASVVLHAYQQIKKTGHVKLFKSHHPNYADGEQLRDFVYVKDVVNVIYWLATMLPAQGIYNLGTGKASTFIQLVTPIFTALGLPQSIQFIDTPQDIRDKYQYFTEANMQKLDRAGYNTPFKNVQEGVEDYVRNYLIHSKYF